MHCINFFRNWNNKLECDVFSTIRRDNVMYHQGNVFEICEIDYKTREIKKRYGSASIVYRKEFYLRDMGSAMAWLDTGMEKTKAIGLFMNMYKYKNFNPNKEKLVYLVLKK